MNIPKEIQLQDMRTEYSILREIHEMLRHLCPRDDPQKELDEQCRVNGAGAQRELKLMTERDRYKAALEWYAVPRVGQEIGDMYNGAVARAALDFQ